MEWIAAYCWRRGGDLYVDIQQLLANSRRRWHSATPRSALAKPAREENVCVTVLPFTLTVGRRIS